MCISPFFVQSSSPWSSRENLRSPGSPRGSPQHPQSHSPQPPYDTLDASRKSSQTGTSGNYKMVTAKFSCHKFWIIATITFGSHFFSFGMSELFAVVFFLASRVGLTVTI